MRPVLISPEPRNMYDLYFLLSYENVFKTIHA